jgi:hypothetical protein
VKLVLDLHPERQELPGTPSPREGNDGAMAGRMVAQAPLEPAHVFPEQRSLGLGDVALEATGPSFEPRQKARRAALIARGGWVGIQIGGQDRRREAR